MAQMSFLRVIPSLCDHLLSRYRIRTFAVPLLKSSYNKRRLFETYIGVTQVQFKAF